MSRGDERIKGPRFSSWSPFEDREQAEGTRAAVDFSLVSLRSIERVLTAPVDAALYSEALVLIAWPVRLPGLALSRSNRAWFVVEKFPFSGA